MSNPLKYPWIRNSVDIDTSVVGCLAITAPTGLYLNQNQTVVNLSQPYYVYLNNWPFYIVNQGFGNSSSNPLRNSKIFFDASFSVIQLYTEDNTNTGQNGAETSVTVNGAYGSNKITLTAQLSQLPPQTGVIADFDGANQRIWLTAANGLWLNGVQITPGGGGGGVTDIQAGTAIQVSSTTGSVTVNNAGVTSIIAGTGISIDQSTGAVTITNTGGGGGGGITWSDLSSPSTIYSNLISISTANLGLEFDNQIIQMSLNANEYQYLTPYVAADVAYLMVGQVTGGTYTLIAGVNGRTGTSRDQCTINTVGSDMYLWANGVQSDPLVNPFNLYGSGFVYLGGNRILPGNGDNRSLLGSNGWAWQEVMSYSYNTPSDITIKENINLIDSNYAIDLIKNINPVSYTFINDKNKKKHFGVIAQEVEKIIGEENLALHSIDNDKQSINYTQFIAPLIKTVQHLLKKVEDLEAEIKELKK